MPQLLAFAKYYALEEAKPLIDLLNKEKIPFTIEHEKDLFDKVYIGENYDPMFVLNIQQEKFQYVQSLIDSELTSIAEEKDLTHYLYSFTDSELLDVFNNSEDWNQYDQVLSRQILIERGIEIPSDQKELKKVEYSPTKAKPITIVAGYFIALLVPLIGVFAGRSLMNSTKTLKNGRQVKMYDQATIKHGEKIFALSLIFLFYYLYLLLKRTYI